ncbi:MAG: GAF domain-containing protein [Gammaproteobacteria bacterium]|nr:GAF domain-containing protein [Gammaproteobacteria bacterium]
MVDRSGHFPRRPRHRPRPHGVEPEAGQHRDVRAEEVYRRGDPLRVATADLGGARSFAAIPMLAGERLLGAFTVYRQQLRPFDDRNLELAQMFADQAAIAIENARLINALASDKG